MKICPMAAKLFHTDGHHDANSSFSQFCKCT